MKRPLKKWERYAALGALLLLVGGGGLFTSRKSDEPTEAELEAARKIQSAEGISPDEGDMKIPSGKVALTACGERVVPNSLLRFPSRTLKSHIAEFEQESSSYLERTKLKSGVSVVVVQELCPKPTVQFSLHFPEKTLVAKPPQDAAMEYSEWVQKALEEIRTGKGFSPSATPLLSKLNAKLDFPEDGFLLPSQPEWGGVQLIFRM